MRLKERPSSVGHRGLVSLHPTDATGFSLREFGNLFGVRDPTPPTLVQTVLACPSVTPFTVSKLSSFETTIKVYERTPSRADVVVPLADVLPHR